MAHKGSVVLAMWGFTAFLVGSWFQWRRWREAITALVFLLGFGMGMIGFYRHPPGCEPAVAGIVGPSSHRAESASSNPPEEPSASEQQDSCEQLSSGQRWADAFFASLQFLTLGVDADTCRGLLLSTARILVPLAPALVIVLALLSRVQQWVLRLRLAVYPPQTLVLGCGRNGQRLATFYANVHRRDRTGSVLGRHIAAVVAVDKDLASLDVPELRRRGVQLLEATLDTQETLMISRAERAETVVVCSGDDLQDLAIARRLIHYLKSARGYPRKHQTVLISVDTALVSRAVAFDASLQGVTLRSLNLHALEARRLLRDYAPHVLHPRGRYRVEGDNPCHIAVIGRGRFVLEVAAQAVRALVYEPSNPIRITVLTWNARAAAETFFVRFPALAQDPSLVQEQAYGAQLPLAHVEFHETCEAPINTNALLAAHSKQPLDVIYVAGQTDAESCALCADAIKVADTLRGQRPGVVVCMREPGVLRRPHEVYGVSQEELARLHDFRLSLQVFKLDAWVAAASQERHPEELADVEAKRVWLAYQRVTGGLVAAGDEQWYALSDAELWSSRCSGDHMLINKALVEASKAEGETLLQACSRDDVLRWLTRLQHRRYVRERLTDGWLSRPVDEGQEGIAKLNAYLLNPTIAEGDKLVEAEHRKDLVIVERLRGLVEEETAEYAVDQRQHGRADPKGA